jgi:site-specific DNA-methyltransferase (adenine-specific)
MKSDIYNEDYKKVVSKLKRNKIKVDAIITDPPYNVSRDYQLGFSNMGRAGMNYGEWDYNFDQKKWIKDVADLVKPGGCMIIFNDWKNLGDISKQLEKCGFIIKDIIRWVKRNPMPRNVERRYVTDCEFAVWAVKEGKPWTFNKPKDVGYLKPIVETGIVPGGKKRLHPTQKHLEVFEQLILIHTNENDVVFDPFLGSGTTGVACKKYNRNFIGAEIDKKYYDIAVERINND